MTRRLILAIFATTFAAVALVGLGTAALESASARRQVRSDLRRQARTIAEGVTDTTNGRADLVEKAGTLRVLTRVLRLDDIAIVLVRDGRVVGNLPAKAGKIGDLIALMKPGQTVDGHRGAELFAAAAVNSARDTAVVVVTGQPARTHGIFGWILLSSGAVLALGTLVAVTLGRRLTRPIRDVEAAAHRIAAGELSTRLPAPSANDHDELADLARSVNTMAEVLERSKSLEQQFLLSVSHDLRTPLTSIRGYAEAITDGATKDPQWAASVILRESRRLERLVRDLLDLAKLQARGFSLEVHRLDLSAAAVSALEGAAPDAAGAGVRLLAQCATPVFVNADRDRLGQVLANLVENAMKYALGTVVVGTAASQDGVAIVWVDDDGSGIAPEDRPHVFERLYVTTRQPRRAEIGSGLGLAIVHELVLAMGGSVAAEAAPSGGARMVVRLAVAG